MDQKFEVEGICRKFLSIISPGLRSVKYTLNKNRKISKVTTRTCFTVENT